MKLYEEFKEYENMWEASKSLKESADPVDEILAKTPDYELEYEGYDEDWYKDKWNYNTMSHDQDYGTHHIPDYTYAVDAVSLFEYLVDLLQEKAKEPITNELMAEYKKLMDAWYKAEGEEEDRASAAMELYIAQHLHEFAELYEEEIAEKYSDAAYEWSLENVEPDYD